jgi:hypothetical protein
MSVTLVCTVIITGATVSLLSGFGPYGIVIIGLVLQCCHGNPVTGSSVL